MIIHNKKGNSKGSNRCRITILPRDKISGKRNMAVIFELKIIPGHFPVGPAEILCEGGGTASPKYVIQASGQNYLLRSPSPGEALPHSAFI
jgi:hypothetical protein